MNLERRFETYHDQMVNTSVLRLPFNSSHSMLLLLPDDMAQLENAVSPAHVSKWLKWMKSRFGRSRINGKLLTVDSRSIGLCLSSYLLPRKYDVYVPKFSIKTSSSLKSVLTEMGMADMFGDRADLTGISEGQKLSISEVSRHNVDNVHILPTGTAVTADGLCFCRLFIKPPWTSTRLEPPPQLLQASE